KGESAILWHRDDLGSDVPTPAARDGVVYVVTDQKRRERVVAVDAVSGKDLWSVELPKIRGGQISSSPLIAANHLYVLRENGVTEIVGPLDSKTPTVLHSNALPDTEISTVASPVPVDDGLLIRTRNFLYRINSGGAE
ncbi:MAG: PQQ-binding-like beta-propeller repeat protein, partial [Planctomycetota bacterium]